MRDLPLRSVAPGNHVVWRAHIPIAMLVLPAFAARLIWRLSHAATAHAQAREAARITPDGLVAR
jgi:hypothetical protein